MSFVLPLHVRVSVSCVPLPRTIATIVRAATQWRHILLLRLSATRSRRSKQWLTFLLVLLGGPEARLSPWRSPRMMMEPAGLGFGGHRNTGPSAIMESLDPVAFRTTPGTTLPTADGHVRDVVNTKSAKTFLIIFIFYSLAGF